MNRLNIDTLQLEFLQVIHGAAVRLSRAACKWQLQESHSDLDSEFLKEELGNLSHKRCPLGDLSGSTTDLGIKVFLNNYFSW